MARRIDRLLAVRFGRLGDVVLTTGVFAHVWETSRTPVHVVTRAAYAPVFKGHPGVERVIALEEDQITGVKFFQYAQVLVDQYQGGRAMFPGRTALLDLHGNLRAWRLRNLWYGETLAYPKQSLWRRLYCWTGWNRARTVLERWTVPQRYAMAFLDVPPPAAALVPRLYADAEERGWAQATLAALPAPSGSTDGSTDGSGDSADSGLVALHPYATHPLKAWPRARWLELIGLLNAAGRPWIVVGRDDDPLLPGNPRDFTNATGLRQTIALLSQCAACVSGDSGPLHLACGVGVPTVSLFGPTVKSWGFQPAGPKDVVIECDLACRPCSLHGGTDCKKGHACLEGISAERVMGALGAAS